MRIQTSAQTYPLPDQTLEPKITPNPLQQLIDDFNFSAICEVYDAKKAGNCANPIAIKLYVFREQTYIKCTYGNLEALNTNEVSCDTVLLTHSPSRDGHLTKAYSNPPKRNRLVLDAESTLVLQDNPPELIYKRCLTNDDLRHLWHIGQAALRSFNQIDLEYRNGVFSLIDYAQCSYEEFEHYSIESSLSGERTQLLAPYQRNPEILQKTKKFIEELESSNSYSTVCKSEEMVSDIGLIRHMCSEITEEDHPELIKIKHLVEKLLEKIEKTLQDIANTPKVSYARYNHITILKALYTQTYDGNTKISLAYAKDICHNFIMLAGAQRIIEGVPRFVSLFALGNCLLNGIESKRWSNFYINLEKAVKNNVISEEAVLDFERKLRQCQELNILPLWLHTYFCESCENLGYGSVIEFPHFMGTNPGLRIFLDNNGCKTQLEKLVGCFTEKDESLFAKLSYRKAQIARQKERVSNFSNKACYKSAFGVIESQINYIQSDEFKKALAEASPMGKAAVSEYLRDLVQLVECGSEELRKVSKIVIDENRDIFKEIVRLSLSLTKEIAVLVGEQNIRMPSNYDLGTYFKHHEELLDKSYNDPEFGIFCSPRASCLGTMVKYQRHPIKTTGLLSVIQYHSQQFLLSLYDKLLFSDKIRSFEATDGLLMQLADHMNARPSSQQAFLDGLQVTPNGYKKIFTIPLRNHSSKWTVTVERDNPSLQFNISFFDEDREGWKIKMNFMSSFLSILDEIRAIQYEKIFSFGEEFNYSLVVKSAQELEFVMKLQQLLEEFTDRREQTGIQFLLAKFLMANGYLEKFNKKSKDFSLSDFGSFEKYYTLMLGCIPRDSKQKANHFVRPYKSILKSIPNISDEKRASIYERLKQLNPSNNFVTQTYFAYIANEESVGSEVLEYFLTPGNNNITYDIAYKLEAFSDLNVFPTESNYEDFQLFKVASRCILLTGHRGLTHAVETYVRTVCETKSPYSKEILEMLAELIRERRCIDLADQLIKDTLDENDPEKLAMIMPVVHAEARRGEFYAIEYIDKMLEFEGDQDPLLGGAILLLVKRGMYKDKAVGWFEKVKDKEVATKIRNALYVTLLNDVKFSLFE